MPVIIIKISTLQSWKLYTLKLKRIRWKREEGRERECASHESSISLSLYTSYSDMNLIFRDRQPLLFCILLCIKTSSHFLCRLGAWELLSDSEKKTTYIQLRAFIKAYLPRKLPLWHTVFWQGPLIIRTNATLMLPTWHAELSNHCKSTKLLPG